MFRYTCFATFLNIKAATAKSAWNLACTSGQHYSHIETSQADGTIYCFGLLYSIPYQNMQHALRDHG